MNIKNFAMISALLIGITGMILFFPVKTDAEYCCPAHRILHSGMKIPAPESMPDGTHAHSEYLSFYLKHYSFFWWGSGLLVLWAGMGLINEIKKRNRLIIGKENV